MNYFQENIYDIESDSEQNTKFLADLAEFRSSPQYKAAADKDFAHCHKAGLLDEQIFAKYMNSISISIAHIIKECSADDKFEPVLFNAHLELPPAISEKARITALRKFLQTSGYFDGLI